MNALIPVCRPHLWGSEARYLQAALDEQWISSSGRFLDAFEQQFAKIVGVKHAVAVTNGTAALHLALDVLGLQAGDEVIVPDFSMVAPVFAVRYCGATPVPVDADSTWNIDPEKIEERISSRTRAIVAVHTYGYPAKMDRIVAIARKHGLAVVEDAAEAHGATLDGRSVGTFGDIACFSFYANKIATTGEGGMLLTDDSELYEATRWKRNMCFGNSNESRFIHRAVGFNYRMTNLQAAVGVAQIEHITEAIQAKIDIARRYAEGLTGIEGITLPPDDTSVRNVFWVYGVLVNTSSGTDRETLQDCLLNCGIETRRFFSPIHKQPFLRHDNVPGDYPVADYLSSNGCYLPSYIGMSHDVIDYIIDSIRQILHA